MYSVTEKAGIKIGAKQKFIELIANANIRDAVGCDSWMYWTIAFHIQAILRVLGRTLTAAQEEKLYERLIDYKNKPLN
tara:strand:+ start:487 stop:720 length:234 start_codon:yes stop_codon:yes gene_type:complete